jgi:UDP-N-acetyl-D-mannosaminuronate dehydrogenase
VPSVASSSVSVPPQRVVIVGQGYVGLPVSMRAVEAGFDLPSSDEADLAEDVFVPRLEKGSGLTARADFAVGYSPERIDPSNRIWNFRNTPKIVAGIDAASLNAIDDFYAAVAVVERLVAAGAEVAAADPLVSTGDVPAGVMVVDADAAALADADVVLVLTDHDEFDWDAIAAAAGKVLDTRNRLAGSTAEIL